MTKRPTITDVSSGYTAAQTLNENFESLQEGFDNTLSRDGSSPNQMEADLDLNGNDLLNGRVLNASEDVVFAGISLKDNLGSLPTEGVSRFQTFQGDGTTTTFTLLNEAASVSVDVFLSGVYQNKGSYTLSGTSLTFSEAPTGSIEVILRGNEVQGPKGDQGTSYEYSSRSDFVSVVSAGLTVPDGTIASDGSVQYVASAGATAISDLPGWLPFVNIDTRHFGAFVDNVGNDTPATQAAVSYADSLDGAEVHLAEGNHRFEGTVTVGNVNTSIIGKPRRACRLNVTAFGPSDALWELPDSYSGRIGGLNFIGTAGKNDPIGIRANQAGRMQPYDITSSSLGNTVMWVTRPFNSDFIGPFDLFFSGYQVLHKDASGVRGSMTAGSNVLTVDDAGTFDAGDVGAQIVQAMNASEANDALVARIQSVTNDTTVVLDRNAPTTFSNTIFSFGPVTASGSSGSTTLTFNTPHEMDAEDVGRYLYVDRAEDGEAIHTTRVASIVNSTTITVEDALPNSVTDVRVFYAPTVYIGGYGLTGTTPINDIVIDKMLIEGFEGPAIIAEGGTHLYINNLKTHGRAWHEFSNIGLSAESLILNGTRRVIIDTWEHEFCAGLPDGGTIRATGERPSLVIEDFTLNSPGYCGSLYEFSATDTTQSVLSLGSALYDTVEWSRYANGGLDTGGSAALRRRVFASGHLGMVAGRERDFSVRNVAGSHAATAPVFIDNGSSVAFTTASDAGFFFITAGDSPGFRAMGVYRVTSGGAVTLTESAGASTTPGNSGTLNVYDDVDGRIVVENNTGTGRRFSIAFLG